MEQHEHMKNALFAESVIMARQQTLFDCFFSSSDSLTGIIFFVYQFIAALRPELWIIN